MSISEEYDASGEPGPNIHDEMWNEICSLRENIKKRDAKIVELEKLSADLIVQATCAEEKGALSMLEHIMEPLKIYATPGKQEEWGARYREVLMKTWRDGKAK